MNGYLLTLPDAPEEEWLAARRAGIGASEIAAVLGISPYDSPFSLWWRKRNGWNADVNSEMSTGTFLEPTIADWFEAYGDPNEILRLETGGLYCHPDRPWQMATPDRLIYAVCDWCDGTGESGGFEVCPPCVGLGHDDKLLGLLECKWVAYSWDGWGEEDTDDVPVHYRSQALWQLDVMGVDEVIICALGPGGFRTYRVRRDETDLDQMRKAGAAFMASLEAGTPPDVDSHSATLPIVRRLNSAIEDREQEIAADIADGWIAAKEALEGAKADEVLFSARLRQAMGTAKTAVLAGKKFAFRSTDNKLMRSK